MLSPENNPANRKTTPPTQKPPPQEQSQKCPRCDSSNTKFCYYNNYSLTQPRYFCKTCRRYWTRGGALRNVPIGGGCRKATKKLKTTASRPEFGPGFKFHTPNLNPMGSTPAVGVEFDLGQISLPRLHPATAGVYTQFITSSIPSLAGGPPGGGPYVGLDLLGLNYSLSTTTPASSSMVQQVQGSIIGGNENQISISSIESLSSINQEMHWKLQQQRLSMIYGPSSSKNDEEIKIGGEDDNNQDKSQEGINLFNNLNNNNGNNNVNTSINNNNSSCENVSEVANSGSNLHGVWGDLVDQNQHQQQQFQFNQLQ